ncbi:hypothetical protein HOC13_00270 [Candidatus Woesearchaeota archaeon]|nr:hypothetical protein [Candidatus Woesearchaeota archaeon]
MQHAHFHLHKRKRKHQKLENFPHPNKGVRLLDKFILVIALLGPVMNVPQVFKIFYYQNPSGVSALTFTLLAVLNIPWLAYGFVHKEKPIILSSALWLITNLIIVSGVLVYS